MLSSLAETFDIESMNSLNSPSLIALIDEDELKQLYDLSLYVGAGDCFAGLFVLLFRLFASIIHLHVLSELISWLFFYMLSIGSVILFENSFFTFLSVVVAYSIVFLAIPITIADLSVVTAARS